MYERFTDRARKAMQLANAEAVRYSALDTDEVPCIEAAHMLWGLLQENTGAAISVLQQLAVEPRALREKLEQRIRTAAPNTTRAKLPQSLDTKVAIERAMEEARRLGHNYVGTEHLLLGLLDLEHGVAAELLCESGVSLNAAREEIVRLLSVAAPHTQQPVKMTLRQRLKCWVRGRNAPTRN